MEKKKAKVSIVMPCYNEQENIATTIECMLGQTFADFELIIVDDCSTDHSRDIILSFSDERIVYLKNEINMGVAKSLNHGLEAAEGQYIARMDADDTCESSRLQKQADYLDGHPDCIVCGSYADVFDGKSTRVQGISADDAHLKKALVRNNPFIHSSVMFRRVIGGKSVKYPETKGFEDYGLWIELSSKGEYHVIPEVLVHRVDINNLATKKTWEGFNKNKIYKKLLRYQWKAIKATGYYCSGILCVIPTIGKILISQFRG